MERATIVLNSSSNRLRVATLATTAPDRTRVEFKPPKRSVEQNAFMWLCLDCFSKQCVVNGRKFAPEIWKFSFMRLLGRETREAPDLENETMFPVGPSSSDLSVGEMADMLTLIEREAAFRGVKIPPHPRWG